VSRDLLDEDGENRMVRTFLMNYSCDRSGTLGGMRRHMSRSGWGVECIPEWVLGSHENNHLTKAGAQLWLRHLFNLEKVA
jgi:hypothetical protein